MKLPKFLKFVKSLFSQKDINDIPVKSWDEIITSDTGKTIKEIAEDNRSITEKVLNHLQSGRTITSRQCGTLFGTGRLSAIIYKLQKRGIKIIKFKNWRRDDQGRKINYTIYGLDPKELINKKNN